MIYILILLLFLQADFFYQHVRVVSVWIYDVLYSITVVLLAYI